MLNKCPVSSYEQVCEVFKNELGEMPDKVRISSHIKYKGFVTCKNTIFASFGSCYHLV